MMRAMILAAGRGVRMRPLTNTTPKPLLKVGGKALIEYHIEALADIGVHDIVVNHAWLGEQMESSLGNGQRYGVRLHYSAEGEQALETAGGIIKALPLLGDAPFIVINGDIWCDYPLQNLAHDIETLAHLVMVDNPRHHPLGDFALNRNKLAAEGEQKLTYSGIGLFSKQLFSHLPNGIRPLAPLLRKAMGQGRISGEHYHGQWVDIGTPERLQQLDQQLKQ